MSWQGGLRLTIIICEDVEEKRERVARPPPNPWPKGSSGLPMKRISPVEVVDLHKPIHRRACQLKHYLPREARLRR